MKYTVLQNKNGGRFFTSYTEDTECQIIDHCNTAEDAQRLCNATKEINEEYRTIAKKILNE